MRNILLCLTAVITLILSFQSLAAETESLIKEAKKLDKEFSSDPIELITKAVIVKDL